MLKSFHSLMVAGSKPDAMYEEIPDSLYGIVVKKCGKLIRQLKAEKAIHPEKSRQLDWLIDEVHAGVSANSSFDKELAYPGVYISIKYDKEAGFLQIIKRLSNGATSVRAYKQI